MDVGIAYPSVSVKHAEQLHRSWPNNIQHRRFTASVAPSGGGNWHYGTLELDVTQGGIESFLLGGHQWRIDDSEG